MMHPSERPVAALLLRRPTQAAAVGEAGKRPASSRQRLARAAHVHVTRVKQRLSLTARQHQKNAASPDGIVVQPGGKLSDLLVEFKAPRPNSKGPGLTDAYLIQIQLTMACTQTRLCDFAVLREFRDNHGTQSPRSRSFSCSSACTRRRSASSSTAGSMAIIGVSPENLALWVDAPRLFRAALAAQTRAPALKSQSSQSSPHSRAHSPPMT